MNEVIRVLKEFREAEIMVWSIVGNHDIPHNVMSYFKTTPLSLLFNSGLVNRLDDGNPILLKKSIINGLSFTQNVDRFKDFVTLFPDLKRVLVMHYATDNTVPGESIAAKDLQMFDLVVAGHDHSYYEPMTKELTTFYRPGSLTRRTKDEHNLTRGIVLYKYTDGEDSMVELKLPIELAEKVFKNKVFSRDIENLYNNNYSQLFADLTADREYADIFEIIDDLPPDVKQQSKESIINYLKEAGIVRIDTPVEKVEESYENQFSI